MNYLLAESCQNTYILADGLDQATLSEDQLELLHSCLVDEERDDALILVNGKVVEGAFYAQMMVLGLDGAFGEFCGNGARAAAAYLFDSYPGFKEYYLVTKQGAHRLTECEDGEYAVHLPLPSMSLNEAFVKGTEFNGCLYVETLEPHLTIEKKMEDEELFAFGKMLNQQKEVFPKGINVNAWHLIEEDVLFVKTYERGVQRLTASCGTGSISACASYKKEGHFVVLTPGGKLDVLLDLEGAILKGPACISYTERKGKWG